MSGRRRRPRDVAETVLGAVVLLVALGFLTWAYSRANVGGVDGYHVVAVFDRVDGLEIGADVRLAGIPVGEVVEMRLDPATYRAEVVLAVRRDVPLPRDTAAAIVSTSLLGSKYVALTPGAEEEMLAEGDRITITQSAINIEELIGKFVFGGAGATP